ncbi:hypothetical protein [Streptomyces mirabilis]|uniref:hypothetical protein n=1 Tax=Streptomyces mirabilis TaxID=68239 RepID=UPI0036820598
MIPQYILPGPFVDHIAVGDDPELTALARKAPMAYLTGDDRRLYATDAQASRLLAAAHTYRRTALYGTHQATAAMAALRVLSRHADPLPATTAPCRHCTSPDTTATTARPPRGHNGPCTPACERPATFCRACRILDAH